MIFVLNNVTQTFTEMITIIFSLFISLLTGEAQNQKQDPNQVKTTSESEVIQTFGGSGNWQEAGG